MDIPHTNLIVAIKPSLYQGISDPRTQVAFLKTKVQSIIFLCALQMMVWQLRWVFAIPMGDFPWAATAIPWDTSDLPFASPRLCSTWSPWLLASPAAYAWDGHPSFSTTSAFCMQRPSSHLSWIKPLRSTCLKPTLVQPVSALTAPLSLSWLLSMPSSGSGSTFLWATGRADYDSITSSLTMMGKHWFLLHSLDSMSMHKTTDLLFSSILPQAMLHKLFISCLFHN